jgi:hypothetical protein
MFPQQEEGIKKNLNTNLNSLLLNLQITFLLRSFLKKKEREEEIKL